MRQLGDRRAHPGALGRVLEVIAIHPHLCPLEGCRVTCHVPRYARSQGVLCGLFGKESAASTPRQTLTRFAEEISLSVDKTMERRSARPLGEGIASLGSRGPGQRGPG